MYRERKLAASTEKLNYALCFSPTHKETLSRKCGGWICVLSTNKMWGRVLPKSLLLITECRTAAYPGGLKLQELGERSLIYSCVLLFPPSLVTDEGVGVRMPSLKVPYPFRYCKMFQRFQYTCRFLPQFSEAKLMKNLFPLMFWGTSLLLFISLFFPWEKLKEKAKYDSLIIRYRGEWCAEDQNKIFLHKV